MTASCPASACINSFDDQLLVAQSQGDAAGVAKVVAELRKSVAAKPTLENSNDLGVGLVLTGKLDEAIKLLEETDQKFPGSARVAANLGTALELKGDNAAALTWIREGVKRDANEHGGSEWLHARILEAKLALAENPKWFENNHVLDLDFGKAEVPTAPEILPVENGKVKGAAQLIEHIVYQVDERTKFVKPPDPIVGDLYASAGDLAIAGAISPLDDRKSKTSPEPFYEGALNYGAPHTDLIRKRLARYKADFAALPPLPAESVADYPVVSKRFDRTPKQTSSLWIYLGAAVALTLVLVAIGAFFDRRRRKRLEANPPPPIPDIDY